MRIGVNTLPLFPGQIGGMETYAVNLLSHLPAIDRQYRYYLFVTRYNRNTFNVPHPNVVKVGTLSLHGVRYAKGGAARQLWAAGRQFPRLSRWLLNALASPNILYGIHRHQIDLWFCPLINLAPRHIRIPSVVSIPDLQPEFYPDFFRKDLLEWSLKRYPASCREATKVITFSEFSRATMVERYGIPLEKIHVIPLGVGDEFLLPWDDAALKTVKAKYALPAEFAFYPANTWPHKNHVTLLKALHLLSAKHGKRLACVFTGVERGGHEAFLKAVEGHNLTAQAHVLGYVEKRDMPLLYRSARFLVFPSLFEGFGLPLLEAMVSGCPVLCSNTTSIPEVVRDAGLYFNPHDPEEMADAMQRILTDEELRRTLVRAGKERSQDFSWGHSARETLKVLEEAASIGTHPSHTHR